MENDQSKLVKTKGFRDAGRSRANRSGFSLGKYLVLLYACVGLVEWSLVKWTYSNNAVCVVVPFGQRVHGVIVPGQFRISAAKYAATIAWWLW